MAAVQWVNCPSNRSDFRAGILIERATYCLTQTSAKDPVEVFGSEASVFTHSLCPAPSPDLAPLRPSLGQFPQSGPHAAPRGDSLMYMLDGLSLLLAVALAVYLLVALLRADRG
ncbi:hypothetical protein PRtIB026_A40760 [Pseudomonas sp. RtIB026]|nr:hypothetical protein PRtIB026_A40760 [Pseudomonas sp. RtIB026]